MSTGAAMRPPNPDYPLRAMVRAGSRFAIAMQGRVFWWRPHRQRVSEPAWRKFLAGDHFKSLPGKYLGEDPDSKPWSWPAYPIELMFDPTEEQIAAELKKLEAP
jgi:hypothetical protein